MDKAFTPIIEVTRPDGTIRLMPLASGSVVIGRSGECAVQVLSPRVSRRHAHLERGKDGTWRVADLGSDNGTLLDGLRIDPRHPVVIAAGCLMQIGPFTLRLLVNILQVKRRQAQYLESNSVRDSVLRVSNESDRIRALAELAPPKLAVAQLRSLEDFGCRLLTIDSAALRLKALCRSVLDDALGGFWAVVITVESESGDIFRPVCSVERNGEPADGLSLSRSLIRAACERNEPVLATNVVREVPNSINALEMSISVGMPSMAAVAIPLGDYRLGSRDLLYVAFPPEYGTGEWLALCALAVRNYLQGETVWQCLHTVRRLSQIEAEVERARQLQQRLIPSECDLPGLDVAIRFSPCSGVAGDYVDALVLPDGRALFVIADVVGKGIPAAMVAVGVQTIVRVAVRRWMGLLDLANMLDAHLVETLRPGAFVTLIAMTIDPGTGEIEAVNGGHPPAIVFSSSNGAMCRDVAARGGIMFGPFPESRQTFEDCLDLTETLALFTDGHFEVFNAEGRMLDIEGFCGLIGSAVTAAVDSSRAADAVIELTDGWRSTSEPRDDQTLMVIRRTIR